MPSYRYKCERCGEILIKKMTFQDYDRWQVRRTAIRGGRKPGDFIHHDNCPEVGNADIIPQAHRLFTGEDEKASPVVYKDTGYSRNNDLD